MIHRWNFTAYPKWFMSLIWKIHKGHSRVLYLLFRKIFEFVNLSTFCWVCPCLETIISEVSSKVGSSWNAVGSCSTIPGCTVKRGKMYFTGMMYKCKRCRKWSRVAASREMWRPDAVSPWKRARGKNRFSRLWQTSDKNILCWNLNFACLVLKTGKHFGWFHVFSLHVTLGPPRN